MPYCKKCGASIDETAKFCPACAAPTSEDVSTPAAEATKPAAARALGNSAKPKKKAPRWRRMVIIASLVVIFVVIVSVANNSHKTSHKTSSQKTSSPTNTVAQQAHSYIAKHGPDAYSVQLNVQGVLKDVRAKQPNLYRIAQDAQEAHDNLNALRENFATMPASGTLGDDETEVFGAANDLKNAMGALVSYTGNPNPATLAHFKSQYQTAVAEWDTGIGGIWKLAGSAAAKELTGTTKPPTL
jgi:competence protein ComGC